MSTKEDKIKEDLYNKGLEAFRKHEFYDAHEYWEDLWSDYRLNDAKFIQGLIQLSVGYFHISNLNINGARGLLNKCKPKLQSFSPEYKGLNINLIIGSINTTLKYLDKNGVEKFNWDLVPKI